MRLPRRSFEVSLAVATLIAFGSLAIAYDWADRQASLLLRRAYLERWTTPPGVEHEQRIIGRAESISLTIALAIFAASMIVGICQRRWSAAVVVVPMILWMLIWIVAFFNLEDRYFP